jgi:hypothetical protein
MMHKEINRLITKLDYASDDVDTQLDVSVELIELLLVQVDRLQSLAEHHGLTKEDYDDYVDSQPRPTIH